MDINWTSTPLNEVLIDVHLSTGATTLPLSFLIDLICSEIDRRMAAELSSVNIETPKAVKLDGEEIANIIWHGTLP